MQKELRYNGLSENPSDYVCPDGDIAAALNLINEEEALRPILPPKDMFTMANTLSILLIHKTNTQTTQKNYIFKSGTSLYWSESESLLAIIGMVTTSSLTPISGFAFEAEETTITDTKAIGNTFIILTNLHTHFFLYKSGSYKYLGTAIPYLPINFGLRSMNVAEDATISVGTIEGYTIDGGILTTMRDNQSMSHYDVLEAMGEYLTERVMALHNTLLQEKCADMEKFGLPFFVRYAFRLYDGSLAMQSAPVLMIPATIPQCIISSWEGGTGDVSKLNVIVNTLAAQLDYSIIGSYDGVNSIVDKCDEWSDIIAGVEVFVSAPLYLYNPSGTTRYFITENFWQSHYNGVPRLTISKRNTQNALYTADNSSYGLDATLLLAMPKKGEGEIKKAITQTSSFYHIASISLNELRGVINTTQQTITRELVPIPDGALANLTTREAMEDGYHAYDDFIYNGAFGYNSRMVYYDATRISGVTKMNVATLIPYTNNAEESSDLGNIKLLCADDNNTFKYNNSTFNAAVSVAGLPVPFFFIPESQIAKLRVIFSTYISGITTNKYKDFSPIRHDHLNGVYVYTGFNNISTYLNDATPPAATSGSITFQEPNKLFLSEVNNPFLIKPANIVTINVAKIIGISTAAKALSLGQFGQFPLYAFTDEGVWALEISSTGTISARQPITRDVCTNPKGITQIDTAVLFPTARGIMLLSGSESQCISDILSSESPFSLSELPASISTYLSGQSYPTSAITRDKFLTFLEGGRMLYDYTHQRIIVFNKDKTYAYVYSLNSKKWGMMVNRITDIVNSYPDAIAVEVSGNSLKVVNYCEDTTSTDLVQSMLITRPLKLDYPDILKTIDTIIQRGEFAKGHVSVILLGARDFVKPYGSTSSYTPWRIIASSTDHYLRGFSGTPYKYFRIIVLSNLAKDESIFGASVQFVAKDTNQPR